jgi:hypothetical protein
MKVKTSLIGINVVLMVALAVLFERPAHAYTDPGTSLLLFQSASAFFTGALFYFRKRLRGLLTRSKVDPAQDKKIESAH